MKNLYQIGITVFFFTLFFSSCLSDKKDNSTKKIEPLKHDASVSFQNLNDGDTVNSTFTVEMGINGMEVEPAGKFKKGFGHHHIIVNCRHINEETTIPADDKHIHYGAGQTETELELEAGDYCLTLQFADGVHKSYGEELSKTINIVVE